MLLKLLCTAIFFIRTLNKESAAILLNLIIRYMNTLKSFLFFIAGICLLLSCSKSDQLTPGLSDLSGDNLKGQDIGCGKVFVVKPNGTDDTGPLQQAFENAKATGSGSVVKLVEGNYYIGFIEIHEFFGSFTGAGKGKTVITAKTGLDCDAIVNQGLSPILIGFVGGNILMCDMTLKMPEEAICSNGWGIGALLMFSDFNSIYNSVNNYINATVNNVGFIGHEFAQWSYSCWTGLAGTCNFQVPPGVTRSHIDLKVTNCTFNDFGWGTQINGIKKGKSIIGTKNNGNVFTNIYEPVVFHECINDVKISVVGNRFNIPEGWYYGIDVDSYPSGWWIEEPLTKPVICNNEENEFNDQGGDEAIWLHDNEFALHPEDNIAMIVTVNNNRINMSAGANAGIVMDEMQNPVLRNNTFTGIGNYGMYAFCDLPGIISKNGFILGNNFTQATFTNASIYLDYSTQNWTVIGNLNATVTNLGVDNVIKNAFFHSGDDRPGKHFPNPEDHMNFIKGKFRSYHLN